MSAFTQKAITNAFIELLGERPLDKITVTDIVSRCDVSRNTFYYHYSDIYALVEELLFTETERIMQDATSYESWQEAFLQAQRFVLENKRAVYHLYHSVSRDQVVRYLRSVTRRSVERFVQGQAAGLAVPPEDIELMTDFYTAALVELMLQWVRDGMKRDLEQYIPSMGRLLEGNIRDAFRRSAARAAAGADK